MEHCVDAGALVGLLPSSQMNHNLLTSVEAVLGLREELHHQLLHPKDGAYYQCVQHPHQILHQKTGA
jgi:hypothetical protein